MQAECPPFCALLLASIALTGCSKPLAEWTRQISPTPLINIDKDRRRRLSNYDGRGRFR
jgi:hypothetical protein